MSESNQQAVSLRPGDAQQGGFLDDVDVTFREVSAEIFDFNGKSKPGTCIKVAFETEDGQEKIEYYRVGSPEKLVPSGDRRRILAVGGATGIMSRSKGYHLITSIINAGFPEDKVSDDVSVFSGLRAHVNLTTLPEKFKGDDGQDKENKAVLVTKILSLPWENQGPAKGGAKRASAPRAAATSAPAQQAAAAPAADGAIAEKAAATVSEIIAEAGGSIARVKLNQQVFRKLANDSDRNAVVQLVGNPEFLKGREEFSFDGTNVEYAA